MSELISIRSALVSVWHKEGLEPLVRPLIREAVTFYSTGGTAAYLRALGAQVIEVGDLTGYPSILGGRVKTLHPKVHGGILARRDDAGDLAEMQQYEIPPIDLVVVDLYPFEETVSSGAGEAEVIEKIDVGGIALIRGAAKNFAHVAVVPSQRHYSVAARWLGEQKGALTLAQRRYFAGAAFDVSSHYDGLIYRYLTGNDVASLKVSEYQIFPLRYGENPHQNGRFYGDLGALFDQLHGKALSYNNIVDIDAALNLAAEFDQPFVAIIKHTNPCGCAIGESLHTAWQRALQSDPKSAFGGVIVCTRAVDAETARSMDELFFEVLIAPDYEPEALEVLKKKKNRILLRQKTALRQAFTLKSALNGYLLQETDGSKVLPKDWTVKSSRQPSAAEMQDAAFGDVVAKHLKSNAIAIVKHGQLIGSGVGQTSRVDAMRQAIAKAREQGFDLQDATVASDAFFPFADTVEMAFEAGIRVVIEPGGSVRDDETVSFCESRSMCLIFTGIRHFRH